METNNAKETKAILAIIERLEKAEAELLEAKEKQQILELQNAKLRVEVNHLSDLLRHV